MNASGTLAAVAIAAMAMALVGCPDKNKTEGAGANASASADANADAGDGAAAATATALDGKKLVRDACLSCHSEHMLAQQRLTPAQWQKTVGKMVIWGANLDPKEIDPVVAYLVSTSGRDAPPGPFVPETVPAGDALTEIAALPDDPFPPGDIERGKGLFVNKCSACHGGDARGALGVALVDKPLLYRAVEFSRTVRRGRGKMIAIPLSDAEIGDVLAYLRSLRNAPLP